MNHNLSTRLNFLFIFVPVLLRGISSVLFKEGALSISEFSFVEMATNIFYLVSLFLFLLQAITWQMVLQKFDLSFAYPFTNLQYVWLMFFGYFYFDEKVTTNNIIGTLFIIIGTLIMAFNKSKIETNG